MTTELKRCTRCVMPETWAGITFNEQGVCSLCEAHDQYKAIDWDNRSIMLGDILSNASEEAVIRGNKYDCIVGYSGGKDSAYTLWAMKKKYGMNPIAVTFDHGFKMDDIAEFNLQQFPQILGVDHIRFTIGNKMRNALCRKGTEVFGDFCWHCHAGVGAISAWATRWLGVDLQVWGEPTALYQTTGNYSLGDCETQDEDHYNDAFLGGIHAGKMTPDGFSGADMFPMYWPHGTKVQGVYLGNYEYWNQRKNVDSIMAYGWRMPAGNESTYVPWDKADCPYEPVRDWQKWLKRGFGRVTFQSSKDIRDGLMDRERALELIARYEQGEPPEAIGAFYAETGILPGVMALETLKHQVKK